MNYDYVHAHHVFPQKFKKDFLEKGINVHDPKYGTWWLAEDHLKNAYQYNRRWVGFFEKNPSKLDILNEGKRIMLEFKNQVNY